MLFSPKGMNLDYREYISLEVCSALKAECNCFLIQQYV